MTMMLWQLTILTCFASLVYGGTKKSSFENIEIIQSDKGGLKECPITNSGIPVYIEHPDCNMFYICENGKVHLAKCQSGLHFNLKLKACDYPETAGCDKGSVNKPKGKVIDDDFGLCPGRNSKFPVYIPHPDDCSKFYVCDNGSPHLKKCQSGLHFNLKIKACDYPENAGCDFTDVTEKPKGKLIDDDLGLCPAKNSKFPVYLPHPDDCNKFYICDSGTPHLKICHPGLHFNPKIKACDYPQNAECDTSFENKPDGRMIKDDLHDSCPLQNNGRPVLIPHPTDCEKFFICNGGEKFPFTCQSGLHFNPKEEACDYPKNAECDESILVKPKGKLLDDDSPVSCPEENSPDNKPILISHPTDCGKFYVCDHGKPSLKRCQEGLNFNDKIQACDYAENAVCEKQMTDMMAPGVRSPFCPAVDGKMPVFFRHPTNCTVYYMCGNGLAYEFVCPARLHFNLRKKVCDYEENANCHTA